MYCHNRKMVCTDFIKIMQGFCMENKQKFMEESTVIGLNKVSNIVRLFKAAITAVQESIALQIGGDGNTVQVDHTFCNASKRKYNRGAIKTKKNCSIQSGYDMQSSLIVMKQVDNIRKPNVVSVAHEQIRSNTKIWSDKDQNFSNLHTEKNKQWTNENCNHSGTINPLTGHIN